jgi:hypothetical protein
MQALERCNSLKDKGSIIVAIEENRQDFEVRLPERPFSSARAMTSSSIRDEAEQDNPASEESSFDAGAFDVIEEHRFFGERDETPLHEVSTSFKKPISPVRSPKALSSVQSPKTQVNPRTPEDAKREEVPAFDDAITVECEMALRVETDFEEELDEELDTIAVKTPIHASGSPTSSAVAHFVCSPKHINPSPETVPITRGFEPLLSEDPEEIEEALPEEEVPKTTLPEGETEEGIEQDLNEHKHTLLEEETEEGIEQDLNEHQRTMGTLAEKAAHMAMLPPRPVTSDLLDPTEKEELENERRKSLAPSGFVEAAGFGDAEEADLDEAGTDETLQEYSVRYVCYLFFLCIVEFTTSHESGIDSLLFQTRDCDQGLGEQNVARILSRGGTMPQVRHASHGEQGPNRLRCLSRAREEGQEEDERTGRRKNSCRAKGKSRGGEGGSKEGRRRRSGDHGQG